MADTKISALPAATLPLAGTEVLPIVQGGTTDNVPVNDLTVRNFRANATTGILQVTGPAAATTRVMTVPNANFTAARTDASQSFTGDQTLSTGNLVIGTSGRGIDFSATPGTGTSELLADYEEGNWTPVVAGSSTAGTYELQSSSATYTKIGRQVTLICFVRLAAAITGGGAGSLTITGLPFAKSSGPYPVGQVVFDGVDWTAGANLACSFATVSPTSTLYFEQTNDNAGATQVSIGGVAVNDFIFFSITYWA